MGDRPTAKATKAAAPGTRARPCPGQRGQVGHAHGRRMPCVPRSLERVRTTRYESDSAAVAMKLRAQGDGPGGRPSGIGSVPGP